MTNDGECEVSVIRYAARSTVRSDVFPNYGIYGTRGAPIEMDYFCWVMRNRSRVVLVDTGFSQAGGRHAGARCSSTRGTPSQASAWILTTSR